MKFSNTDVTSTPEILKRKTGGELFIPLAITALSASVLEVKAGNVVDADGAIATTSGGGTSNAIGVLLNDVTAENPNGTVLRAFGTINEAAAKAHSGHTITDAEKTALSNIIFE